MRSAFFPFHVAVSGIHAARANLTTIAHNVANAEIPGFSRQSTVQQASRPLHLMDSRGMYGTGATTTAIIQHRDRFLDMKFWHQRAILGEHSVKTTNLSFVETVFNNLPDAGVLRAFNEFFGRMHDLRGNTPDATFRTNVITGGEALADMIRHNALALQTQQLNINREIADVVMIMNSLGQQIATISRQIYEFERDGSNANDLRDRRNLLIDELSQYVNVEVTERDFSTPMTPNDRRTTVKINGYDFVRHDMHFSLELVARQQGQRRNEMDVEGLYDITFAGGQGTFDMYSHSLRGELRGLIDVRDGNNSVITEDIVAVWPPGFVSHAPNLWTGAWPTGMDYTTFDLGDPATWPAGAFPDPDGGRTSNYKGVPFYMNQLNHLVRTFARAINEGLDAQYRNIPGAVGHVNGFDINGDYNEKLFFTYIRPDNAEPAAIERGEDATSPDYRKRLNCLLLFRNTNTGQLVALSEADATPVPADLERVVDADGFQMYTMDLSGMNALNFIINPELTRNNSLLATSNHPDQGESNNQVIQGFSLVGTFPHLFREGRLEDFVIAVSDHLGIDSNQALNFAISYDEIITQTHNQRLSVMGVDINEEMMEMVRFQHMFRVASRMINTIDAIYDTLINRMGAF